MERELQGMEDERRLRDIKGELTDSKTVLTDSKTVLTGMETKPADSKTVLPAAENEGDPQTAGDAIDTGSESEDPEKTAGDAERIVQEETITVTMTRDALFDFFLYHAYSKLGGFLQNLLGLAVFFLGVFSYARGMIGGMGCFFFILASACFLGYTPLMLRRAADRAMQEEMYRTPMDITFREGEGVLVNQGGSSRLYPWEDVLRASVTPKTISIYTGKDQALIIPKQDFGDKFLSCYQIIARSLGMSRFTGH